MIKGLRAIKKAVVLLLVLTFVGLGVDYSIDSSDVPNVYTLVPLLLLIVLCLVWLVMNLFRALDDRK